MCGTIIFRGSVVMALLLCFMGSFWGNHSMAMLKGAAECFVAIEAEDDCRSEGPELSGQQTLQLSREVVMVGWMEKKREVNSHNKLRCHL